MNSFSIMPYEHQSILDAYQQWLVGDLYQNYYLGNLDDPNFLQKLSILQAEGIRHDIGVHAAVTHGSIQDASAQVGRKIQSAASLITSSLDDGFSLMNTRMMEVSSNLQSIDRGIGAVNQTLQQGNQILSSIDGGINDLNRGIGAVASGIDTLNRNVMAGMDALNQNMMAGMDTLNHNMMAGMKSLNHNMKAGMAALSSNIAQAASAIMYQMQQMKVVLEQILDELRIPESQRERRYHIEEGMKYFNKGMSSGDCRYFEDALDEFTQATTIERKDFFSWYYIGMIHLYSKEHLDIEKALSAFDRYIHYADALPQKHNLFDEAWMMKAECKYLMQDMDAAFGFVEKVMTGSDKAALRGMKYLSATGDSRKQQQAVEILKRLMRKNPYFVMQVLEDYDLVNNEYVIEFLNGYKAEAVKEISQKMLLREKEIETLKQYSLLYYKDVFDEFNALKAQVRAKNQEMGVIDVVALKEKIQAMPEKIEKAVHVAQGLVDLGLPSGTLWKGKNETGGHNGFYTYEEALRKYRNNLPTKKQLEELKDQCRWTRNGSDYTVTGPNGDSIVLPASGWRHDDGRMDSVGFGGLYWSSTPNGSCKAWYLYFNSGEVGIESDNIRYIGFSVRLVKN